MTPDLLRDLRRFEGLALRRQLLDLGHSPGAIARSISRGLARSPRRGWLCTPDAPIAAVRAVELGGKLGGASALETYGIWVDAGPVLIATPPSASRLPAVAVDERRIWVAERFPDRHGPQWRVSPRDALLQHAGAADRASLVASLDSALHSRKLTGPELTSLVSALPRSLRGIREQLDSRAMSGTESKLRLACVAAGLTVELQASINNVGFVDLLVEGWLIVEVDSRKFHDGPTDQHRDRVRDGNAVLGGYGHLRFNYPLVQFDLEWCVDVILTRLRSGRP
ncbi:MAG TPA: hypothetical protein VHX87_05145 [Galbitalea sp.]|jgi:very-short-patch-repair endonuclease|nr:hypothetical protein [Galbitalea sp.]